MSNDNSNCTFYMDGGNQITRAYIKCVMSYGLCVEVDAKAYRDYSGKEIEPNYQTVSLPGVPSYLLDIDDDLENISGIGWYDLDGNYHEPILYSVSDWQWRDIAVICNCGSINYERIEHGGYHCKDCNCNWFYQSKGE